jgi:hypothetical protein
MLLFILAFFSPSKHASSFENKCGIKFKFSGTWKVVVAKRQQQRAVGQALLPYQFPYSS